MSSYIHRIMALAALLVGALSAAAFIAPGTAPADDKPLRLYADISERTLYVEGGNVEPRSYPIAVGTSEHPTPRGEFTIEKIIWDPAWVPPPDAEWAEDETRKAPDDPDNPMEAVKIYFQEPDYYIHGSDASQTIGTAASHGCLRMHPSDAEELARILMEHGGESRSEAWYRKVERQDAESRTVRLSDPVPLVVTQ